MNGTQSPTLTKKPKTKPGKRLVKPKEDGQRSEVRDEERKSRRIPGGKRWRHLTWRERLILLVPVAVAIAAVVTVNLLFNRQLMRYELTGEPCQYYGGSIYRMREGTTLLRTSEGKTVVKDSTGKHNANNLPIYYEDRSELTIAQDMIHYAPRSGTHGRLGYFSEVKQFSESRISVFRDGEELDLESGFLYDGGDLYIFLEPVILSFNGYRIVLPALSYVEAVYTGDIMVFNYASKEFLMEPPQGPVTARIETGDYEISLLNDSMTTYAGKRTLLFSRPELLDLVG